MFFDSLERFSNNLAAVDGAEILTYSQLSEKCDQVSAEYKKMAPSRKLIFLKAHNCLSTLIYYLAALRHHHVVMLLDPKINDEDLANLLGVYQPNLLIEETRVDYLSSIEISMDERLCILLSTSGSTGSPKQVALSDTNIHSNALSISQYLPIRPSDKTITTLPFYYSYGLSVVHSHLLCGACLIFNRHSVVSREFWSLFRRSEVSSFAAVPHMFEMLVKLRFENMKLPSLRYFTHAGGKLSVALTKQLAQYCVEQNKLFFSMYGQTEATARMAYQSLSSIIANPEAIGKAIPGGKLCLVDQLGNMLTTANVEGEIVYEGQNVMLGYASQQADLCTFVASRKLLTGDIGKLDEHGNLYVTGRSKRIIKLFGQRINLDEIEQIILSTSNINVYAFGDDVRIVLALAKNDMGNQVLLKSYLVKRLTIHHSAIEFMMLDELPMTANGKKDYVAAMRAFSDDNGEAKFNG